MYHDPIDERLLNPTGWCPVRNPLTHYNPFIGDTSIAFYSQLGGHRGHHLSWSMFWGRHLPIHSLLLLPKLDALRTSLVVPLGEILWASTGCNGTSMRKWWRNDRQTWENISQKHLGATSCCCCCCCCCFVFLVASTQYMRITSKWW